MLGTINPEILFLQQEDQIKAGLLDMKMILKITEDTYKMLGQGQIQNPPKVHLGIPEGTEWESFFNTMPSYIGGDLIEIYLWLLRFLNLLYGNITQALFQFFS